MVRAVNVPSDSGIHEQVRKAHFWDAFEIDVDDAGRSALYWYLHLVSRTPGWIEVLMSIRNFGVGLIGLKDVGNLSNAPPPSEAEMLGVGARVGIFTIRALNEKEVLLEIVDTHLDVILSVYREDGPSPKVKVITTVSNHNMLGWLYMLPVAPLHKVIVRAILSNR